MADNKTSVFGDNPPEANYERLDQQPVEVTIENPVLSSTNGRRRYYNRGRGQITGIPAKIEALLVLLTDGNRPSSTPLSREELDVNPITRDLPSLEKDTLVKCWPDFNAYLADVASYKERLADSTRIVTTAHGKAAVVKRDMGDMPLGQKLQTTSELLAGQVFEASVVVSQMKLKDLMTDQTAQGVYKFNVGYIKDMLEISKKMSDLGQRMYEAQEAEAEQNRLVIQVSDEAEELLVKARQKLAEAGVDASD